MLILFLLFFKTHSYADGSFVHQYCWWLVSFNSFITTSATLLGYWYISTLVILVVDTHAVTNSDGLILLLWFCFLGNIVSQKLNVVFNITAVMVVYPYYILFWFEYFIRPSATLLGCLYISTIAVLTVKAQAITALRWPGLMVLIICCWNTMFQRLDFILFCLSATWLGHVRAFARSLS